MERSATAILDALRAVRLLDASQSEELGRKAWGDGTELLEDLKRRGWLTEYQAEQAGNGRVDGLLLEPYLLLRPLGRGGMGQVFQAVHRKMKRVVALKVMRPDLLADEWAVRRFHREIEAVARLAHPNIVMAYDAGEVQDTHFLVMEFVEGIDLARVLEESGRLPASQAIDIVRQACLGLQHAHEQGLIHRDIKPSNLMITSRGAILKILDLGLARINPWNSAHSPTAGGGPMARLTPSGMPVGTPDYLAPEQLLDPVGADIRSDLYSLGCTFYHLLAGRPPFGAGNLFQTFLAHRESEPTRIEQIRRELPAGLGDLVHRLMAKRPENRYASPADVIEALDALPPPRDDGSDSRSGPRPLLPRPPGWRAPTPQVGADTTVDLGRPILPGEIPDDLVPIDDGGPRDPGSRNLSPLEPIVQPLPEAAAKAPTVLDRGWAMLRYGDPRRALADFDLVLAEDHDEPRAWLGRGQALIELGDPRQALDDLARYLEMCPRDPEGHYQHGLARLAEGASRRKAIEDFTRAIELDPGHPQAYLHRGMAFARRRDDPRALADYEEALRLDPTLASAHFHRGLVHDRHRRFELAIADYNAALRIDPRHARAFNNRGQARMLLNQVDEAIADYREALAIDPKYAVAHQNIGLALFDRGDFDAAIAHLNRAERLDPDLDVGPGLARAFLKRGQERGRKGDHPTAIADFTEALRIDPGLATAYQGRGVSLARIGEVERAIQDLGEAIRLDPDFAQAYYNRGLLLARRGESERARLDRETALRLDPNLARKSR
ncbi:MAG: tetratricopeptide repeat protein [Isosphaeraceae bacterium]